MGTSNFRGGLDFLSRPRYITDINQPEEKMNVKMMSDMELVNAFKGFGLKMDKTTKIARVAVLTELMSRPFFKRKCDEMGMSYTDFVQKSEMFINLSK